jgi:primosomal protein N'
LTERAALHLPPYARLTRILFELAGSGRAERAAKAAGQRLTAAGIDDFSISPCPIPERDGRERWQVLIKGDPKRLAKIVERTWSVDVDPIELM